jgi:hypothetical protein
MLSLNRLNRFHLINYDHDVASCVNETIVKFYRCASPLQVSHLEWAHALFGIDIVALYLYPNQPN